LVKISREEFKEMMELGFLKQGEWTQTMKKHSKGKRHKKYVVEYKYDRYLKWKNAQKKKNENKE
jgi:hypothetical protein